MYRVGFADSIFFYPYWLWHNLKAQPQITKAGVHLTESNPGELLLKFHARMCSPKISLGPKSTFIDFDPELFRTKSKEKALISGEIRTNLVAEEGLEPSASGL